MTAEAVERAEAGTTAPPTLWTHWDFNKLWLGQSISVVGSQVTIIALPLTAILMLHAGPTEVGLLSAAGSVASLAMMLLAGVLVDRVRRRPLMIAADLGRAALIGLIPLLAMAGMLTIHVLYAVAVGLGVLTVVFDIAIFAYVPTLLTGEQLVAANSRMSASNSVGGILGSSLGGLMVDLLRPALALFVDAASFLCSVVGLLAISGRETLPERRAEPSSGGLRRVFADIGEGLRVTYGNRYLRPLTFNSACANICSMVILTLFILYAVRDLRLSAAEIGIIYAAGSAGGVIAALTATWVADRIGFGPATLVGMAVFRVLAVTPLVRGPVVVEVALLSVVWFVTVYGVILSNLGHTAITQYVVPSELRGRVLAAARALGLGVLPLGALLAGELGQLIGLQATIGLAAALLPPSILWGLLSPVRGLRKLTDAVQVHQAEAEAA